MLPSRNNLLLSNKLKLRSNQSSAQPASTVFYEDDEMIGIEPDPQTQSKNSSKRTKKSSWLPRIEDITVNLPCKHRFTDMISFLPKIKSIQCHQDVIVILSCGHAKSVECYQSSKPENIKCEANITTTLNCGHDVEAQCGSQPVCDSPCKKKLECGHSCGKMCVEEHSHERKHCTANCSKQLICGHYCANGCVKPDEHTVKCLEKCQVACSHGVKFPGKCWSAITKCTKRCPYRCEHSKCTKPCFEECNRPACNAPCRRRLPCFHLCSGLCGEPCPPCHKCNPDKQCSITLRKLGEFEEGERSYVLPECGCVFSVEALDIYFNTPAMSGNHVSIQPWCCPVCSETIYTAPRYSTFIKTANTLLDAIKTKMIEKENEKTRVALTQNERRQIIKAMNAEVGNSRYNMVGGRWFVCKNQHPYYIGECGGAVQISKCPECGVAIGGSQHKLLKTNKFYGEFDGSAKPAWPT